MITIYIVIPYSTCTLNDGKVHEICQYHLSISKRAGKLSNCGGLCIQTIYLEWRKDLLQDFSADFSRAYNCSHTHLQLLIYTHNRLHCLLKNLKTDTLAIIYIAKTLAERYLCHAT